MKEEIYGWYPSAKSIWCQDESHNPYRKECLYKHRKSRYNGQLGVPTPVPSFPIHDRFNIKTLRPASGTAVRKMSAEDPVDGLSLSGRRAPSVNLTHRSATPQYRVDSSRRTAWKMNSPTTNFIPAQSQYYYGGQGPCPQKLEAKNQESAWSTYVNMSKIATKPKVEHTKRIQSATHQRPITTPPVRLSKSAGPYRKPPCFQTSGMVQRTTIAEEDPYEPENEERPKALRFRSLSPNANPDDTDVESPVDEDEDDGNSEDDDSIVEGNELMDYDEQLSLHGWRFEVPGDPYGLKKPCLPARLPISVKLPVPTVAPNPPTGHMENPTTFFSNTIPRRRAQFAIHNEWMSEALHAQRIEMQRRQGVDYNFNRFAFIY